MQAAPHWHVTSAAGPDAGDYTYRLELERGEGDAAYVHVQCWESRQGDVRFEVLGEWPLGDVLGREAADALRHEAARAEQALGWAVLDGRPYALATRGQS